VVGGGTGGSDLSSLTYSGQIRQISQKTKNRPEKRPKKYGFTFQKVRFCFRVLFGRGSKIKAGIFEKHLRMRQLIVISSLKSCLTVIVLQVWSTS
jgi:hypothetical protein